MVFAAAVSLPAPEIVSAGGRLLGLVRPVVAEVVIGSPEWGATVGAVVAAVLAIIGAASLLLPRPSRVRLLLATLKICGMLLLAVALLNPLWARRRAAPGDNLVLLVGDNSASLQIRPGANREDRGSQVRALLGDVDAEWQIRLGQDFDVRRYVFGQRLTRVERFDDLQFDEPASNLFETLRSLEERFADRPVAAIVLATDGNATDPSGRESLDLSRLPPIYPLRLATAEGGRDLSVSRVSISDSAFEDAPITVQATVEAEGEWEDDFVATIERIVPTGGEPEGILAEQILPIPNPGESATVRFRLPANESGALFYRLRVRATGDENAFAEKPRSREVTLANNERLVSIDRPEGPLRILYVAGRPNWEHKFLNRAVAEDEQIQLVSLIRIARKEAKFDFRGRVGESSNPLFRGFREAPDEETESYDQPVLIRLNTRDEAELRDGFPKSKAQLFTYDGLIIDDLAADFFTHDQQQLLEDFVAVRGGGLLMLGGLESFDHGGWERTPLRHVLPVTFERTQPVRGTAWRWQLTKEGLLQPWVRLRDDESTEQQRLNEMAEFEIINPVATVKPAARVLAQVRSAEGTTLPALVVQQFGRGHAGTLLVGDWWRWGLKNLGSAEEARDDLAKAWRQTLRWLVNEVPGRAEIGLDWTSTGGQSAVDVQVRLRSEDYEPRENAAVQVIVTRPDGTTVPLRAEPSIAEPGLFTTTFVPRERGAYLADVQVLGQDGEIETSAKSGWTSDPAAEEFQRVRANDTLLDELASETGGEVLTPDKLDDFAAGLPNRDVPLTTTEVSPLWHSPWLLLIALGCLAAEWGLRRVGGLP